MAAKRVDTEKSRRKANAYSPEDRENQMIAMAMNEVEQRILNHTATSQELVHFLKLGTAKEKLEREKLAKENELLRAKTEAIQAQKRYDELIDNALNAMKLYSGQFQDEYEEILDEYD